MEITVARTGWQNSGTLISPTAIYNHGRPAGRQRDHHEQGHQDAGKGLADAEQRITSTSVHPPQYPATAPAIAPQADGQRHGHDAGTQREPRSIDYGAEGVAAEHVGAQDVFRRRRAEPFARVQVGGGMGAMASAAAAVGRKGAINTRPSHAEHPRSSRRRKGDVATQASAASLARSRGSSTA